MKISNRWLRELVPTTKSAEEIGQVLTATGLEVEGIERIEDLPGGLDGLVVGKVLTREQHPNADRLSLCTVDVGTGEPLSIVCGASNVRAGLDVIVATVGATLYPAEGEPFKIKKGKIRGEVSEGMICAEDEIGVGNSHAGIIELEGDWAAGTPAATVYGVGADEVIEIGLTPNRTDGMSHMGVARDLAAGLNCETVEGIQESVDWSAPACDFEIAEGADCPVKLEVEAPDGAPRYCGCVIEGVQVGPSPDWVQRRLQAIGVGPINNVVDATNFVLHEMGTPLHAFDADVIAGNEVKVRRAEAGEKFTTLDDIERELDAADLVIADSEKPMCLAGVFGGATSGVSEKTTRVFLESAWFEPVSVRKTARRHGLSTDASFRFERGVDPALTWTAMERAASLIVEWAGGEVRGSGVQVEAGEVPGPATVSLTFKQLEGLIGERLERGRVRMILSALEIEIIEETEAALTLRVPAYRADVTRPADVVEEILRIHGFDRVPLPKRMAVTLDVVDGPDRERGRMRIAELLVSRGYAEVMNNSLTRAADAEGFLEASGAEESGLEPEKFVAMLNPLSSDLGVMRQTLLFQGLETIARNRNVQRPDLRLFELGRTYKRQAEGFEEKEWLGIWLTGAAAPESWNGEHPGATLFDLKADVEALLGALGVQAALTEVPFASAGTWLEGLRYETLTRGDRGAWVPSGEAVGRIGRAHPDACAVKDLAGVEVFYAEFEVEALIALSEGRKVRASDLAKFPSVRRDLSLLVPAGITFSALASTVKNTGRNLVKSVNLFDVYAGKGLPEGTQSYAISIVLQDESKTLNDKQIDKTMQRILEAITAETGATLRAAATPQA